MRVLEEKGSVMIEFSFSAAFLVFLTFGLYGFGALLLSYANLTQVAHEATRTLSSVSGLATGSHASNDAILIGLKSTCQQSLSSDPRCGHLLAQNRAFSLIRFGNVLPSAELMNQVLITTRYQGPTGNLANPQRETVKVELQVPLNNILEEAGIPFDVGSGKMTVTAEGPYLLSQTFRDLGVAPPAPS